MGIQKHVIGREYQEIGLHEIAVFVILLLIQNADFMQINGAYWFLFFASIYMFIILNIKRKYKFDPFYFFWIISVSFMFWISQQWAISKDLAFDSFKLFIRLGFVLFYINSYIKNEEKFRNVLKMYVWASAINAIYILAVANLSVVGTERLGESISSGAWNSNNISINAAFSAFFAIYIMVTQSSFYKKYNLLYKIFIALFFIEIILTSSRKGFLAIALLLGLYFLFVSKNKIRTFLIVFLATLLIGILIMNVPILYNFIGNRVDALVTGILVNNVQNYSDTSLSLRSRMLEYGFNWFNNKPFLGYGINNYCILLEDKVGLSTYSHNNYIELLVGIGVVGTIIYYLGYIRTIIYAKKLNRNLFIFSLAVMITILVMEIGMVSINSVNIQFFLCLCFSMNKFYNAKSEKAQLINEKKRAVYSDI